MASDFRCVYLPGADPGIPLVDGIANQPDGDFRRGSVVAEAFTGSFDLQKTLSIYQGVSGRKLSG